MSSAAIRPSRQSGELLRGPLPTGERGRSLEPGKSPKGLPSGDSLQRGGGTATLPKADGGKGVSVVEAQKTAAPGSLAGTPEPSVAQLLSDYNFSGPVGRPAERILKWFAFIDQKLRSVADPDKLIDAVTPPTFDLRRFVFLAQGSFKLYKERYGKPYEEGLERIKILEDGLGRYVDCRKLRELAEQKSFPAAAIEVLKKNEANERATLREIFVKGWGPGEDNRVPEMKRALDTIMTTPWDGYVDDHKFVRDALGEYLKKVQKTDYDMQDLQGGVHELRRDIRWFPVFAEALDGLILLDPEHNPSKYYQPMLDKELATTKYVVLPPPSREVDPVHLSKSLYLGLMQAVLDFGGLKDTGENVHFLAEALHKSGDADSEKASVKLAEKLLGVDKGAHHKVHEDAQKLYDTMKEHKLLKQLRIDLVG